MSQLASRTPRGVSLGQRLAAAPALPARRAQPSHAALAAARCARFKSTGPDFKSQMVESISQRLAREKADLERLGNIAESSGAGKNWSITVSKAPLSLALDRHA